VVPLLLTIAGVLALAAAALVQRGFGPRARVGRLLAVAPKVSIAEALRIADAGESRYVRVDGRLDSTEEFEDDAHRPLVIRRTTIDWRPAGATTPWTPIDSSVELVRFSVREGLDEIAVDGSALAEGLVVVPREWTGTIEDLGDRAPTEAPPGGSARVVIEHASTVEHATVAGVPRRTGSSVSIGPGFGRPLILTTLESDEAMRVLTGGAAGRARLAIGFLVAGGLLLLVALLWMLGAWLLGGAATALAASPEPSIRPGSDTRTTGGGPGLVGDPALALLGVLGIALVSVLASLAYVRLTGGPRSPQKHGPRVR
jgi:hypothetical protein